MMAGPWLSTVALVLNIVIIVWLVPRIVIQRRESAATLAWVLFILLVPLGGALMYYLLGTRRMKRKRLQRARTRAKLAPGRARASAVLSPFNIDKGDDTLTRPARLFHLEPDAATRGNDIRLLSGQAMFDALEDAIAAAQHYVHVEFYIFHPDHVGCRLLQVLERKAKEGVEVRLLVDAVGARDLARTDLSRIKAAGVKFAEFLPVSPITKPFSVNFRNHRKIVVIDGHTAFTGGMNVGDEYRGRRGPGGRWRDTHVMLRGPAAIQLQEIFADDWHFTTGEPTTDPRYFPEQQEPGTCVVQVVASGPDATAEAIHRKIFTAIARADKRVWLTTPYFVPDRAILVALYTAAGRGVDVRMLVPGISDHPLVLYAGRSQYDELLASGVRIFEYQKGMLHAKTMVVDDIWTTIGSANMDMRSFVLNWEANLVVLDQDLASRMSEVFLQDIQGATEVTAPRRANGWQRLREAGCYVLSPLL